MLLKNYNSQDLLDLLNSLRQNNFASTIEEEQQLRQIKSTKDINYFDSKYNDFSNINVSIINVDRHVFY